MRRFSFGVLAGGVLACWLLLGLLASPSPAVEAPPPDPESWSPLDSIFSLPPVSVSGDPVRRHRRRELGSLAGEIIDPAAHPRRLATPGELLAELPGVERRSLGGLGSFSTASIRGSGGQEVAVYLDGVDLRSPFTGLALLDELPLVGLRRLEVYRGAAPAELGGGATAGAVNVVTGGPPGARLTLGGGSFGTRRAGLSLQLPAPWGAEFFLAAAGLASESDFAYLDRNGTTVSNAADDTLRLRRNADLDARDLLARLRVSPAGGRIGGRWTLSYRYLRRENGIPGSESLPTSTTRSLRSGHDGRLRWESPLLPGRLLLRGDAFARRGWTRFLNPEGETGPFLVADETRDELRTLGAQGRAELFLLPLHLLLRAESRVDRFLPENLNPRKGKGFTRSRRGRNLVGEARLLLGGDALLLTAAYGHENLADNYKGEAGLPWLPPVEQPEHATSERFRRAGLAWRILSWPRGGKLSLRGNLADGYRAPSLLELFGQDVSVTGNPELSPERGEQSDLGLIWRGVALGRRDLRLRGKLVWFRRDLRDQILFLRNSQYSVRAENLSASRVTGRELSLALDWRRWRLTLADTRLDARDRGGNPDYDGKQLPYRSPRRSFARLAYSGDRLALHLDVDHRAATYSDRYNDPDRRLPAATLLGAGLAWRQFDKVELIIEGRNLADVHVEDSLGYPLPGRSWSAGLEWTPQLTLER
jgi:iron complex outermembrane recepter protein